MSSWTGIIWRFMFGVEVTGLGWTEVSRSDQHEIGVLNQ